LLESIEFAGTGGILGEWVKLVKVEGEGEKEGAVGLNCRLWSVGAGLGFLLVLRV